MRSARPRFEECDRLAAYSEYMRDLADRHLEERQRRHVKQWIVDLGIVALVAFVVVVILWD